VIVPDPHCFCKRERSEGEVEAQLIVEYFTIDVMI
jgi:hypothetical protein